MERFRDCWDDSTILGASQKFVYDAAVPHVMHSSTTTMGLINLAFLAGNGVTVKLRNRGASLTSFGSVFYHGKKVGKSNYTDFVYDNAELFELEVNKEQCAKLKEVRQKAAEQAADDAEAGAAHSAEKDETPHLTGIVYKNVGPEEMLARCDPDVKGRRS